MGIIIRQGILNSIISYIGIVLGFLLTIRFYPYILEPEQYGLTRVLLSFSFIGVQVGQLGMKNLIIRYFPYFQARDKDHHGILFLAITVPLVGILLMSGLMWIFKPSIIAYYSQKSPLFTSYYTYVIPLFISTLYFEVLNSYLRSLYDSVTASFIQDVVIRLLQIVLLGFYAYGYFEFEIFMIWFIGIYAAQPLILFIYIVLIGQLKLKPDFSFLNWEKIKDMTAYAVFSLMSGITGVLVGNIDILMLGSMTGLGDAAIYFVAFAVGSVISVPKRSISKIASPMVATAFRHSNFGKIQEIYHKTSLNQIIVGVLIFIGIWANLNNLMIILPKEYAGGTMVIIIIGLGKLFDMATGINGGIIMNSQYYWFNFTSSIILVIITVITNYILIPIYGILGAAMATTLSILLYNSVKLIFVWIKLDMQPFTISAFWISCIGACVLLLALQVGMIYNVYIDIIVRSSAMSLLYIGTIYFFDMSKDLNKMLVSIQKRLQNYLNF